jgi:ABC-type dipeptide/oligopeptide/nickel transport system permease component
MIGFAIKRVLWLIPTLLVVTLLTYFIMELTPGSPFDLENANGITPEMIARLEEQYGLDKPWYERYVIYVKNAVQGDFGESYSYRPQQVSDIIERTLPVSLKLGGMATLFAVVFGMTLGILAAVNQNGIIDYISITVAILFYSMPNFVMGFVLILLFAIW